MIDLHKEIIDLYLDVKIWSSEDIDMYNSFVQEKEKVKLLSLPPKTIIGYIKQSLEILMNLKVD